MNLEDSAEQQSQEMTTDFYGAWRYVSSVLFACSTPAQIRRSVKQARQQADHWSEQERLAVMSAVMDGSMLSGIFQPDFITRLQKERMYGGVGQDFS